MPSGEQLTSLKISRRAGERLRAGQVWVYRSDVESGEAEPGALVELVDGRGSRLGIATYSAASTIAARLLTAEAVEGQEGFLRLVEERVRAAMELRRRLRALAGSTQVTDGERLIFSEADGLPGVVLDRYADVLVLQLLTQGVAKDDVRGAIVAGVKAAVAAIRGESKGGIEGGPGGQGEIDGELTMWERSDPRIRELEQLPAPPTEPLLSPGRGEPRATTIFHLNGLGFEYDVNAGQKTGAFLDQRRNYRAAEDAVRGLGGVAAGRALDVCTYQGGFALHLARVCGRVTGVDASRAALEAADRNLERNRDQAGAEVDWVEADAFALLRAWDEAGERFGTVVLDPPAFAKTRNAVAGAMRGYKEMNLRALRMLEPGGVLVTCSCSHHVSEAALREVLASAAADAGRRVQVLESRGAAPDHPEIATLPETRYLKCLICRVE